MSKLQAIHSHTLRSNLNVIEAVVKIEKFFLYLYTCKISRFFLAIEALIVGFSDFGFVSLKNEGLQRYLVRVALVSALETRLLARKKECAMLVLSISEQARSCLPFSLCTLPNRIGCTNKGVGNPFK